MFNNTGVPPDYIGLWQGQGQDGPLTGLVTSAGFKFVHTQAGDQLSVQTGDFHSWECIGDGAVLYDLTWTHELPDGTVQREEHCEFARVDLQAGTWSW